MFRELAALSRESGKHSKWYLPETKEHWRQAKKGNKRTPRAYQAANRLTLNGARWYVQWYWAPAMGSSDAISPSDAAWHSAPQNATTKLKRNVVGPPL